MGPGRWASKGGGTLQRLFYEMFAFVNQILLFVIKIMQTLKSDLNLFKTFLIQTYIYWPYLKAVILFFLKLPVFTFKDTGQRFDQKIYYIYLTRFKFCLSQHSLTQQHSLKIKENLFWETYIPYILIIIKYNADCYRYYKDVNG